MGAPARVQGSPSLPKAPVTLRDTPKIKLPERLCRLFSAHATFISGRSKENVQIFGSSPPATHLPFGSKSLGVGRAENAGWLLPSREIALGDVQRGHTHSHSKLSQDRIQRRSKIESGSIARTLQDMSHLIFSLLHVPHISSATLPLHLRFLLLEISHTSLSRLEITWLLMRPAAAHSRGHFH